MNKNSVGIIEKLRDIKSGMVKEQMPVFEFVLGGVRFKSRQPHMRFGDRVRLKKGE